MGNHHKKMKFDSIFIERSSKVFQKKLRFIYVIYSFTDFLVTQEPKMDFKWPRILRENNINLTDLFSYQNARRFDLKRTTLCNIMSVTVVIKRSYQKRNHYLLIFIYWWYLPIDANWMTTNVGKFLIRHTVNISQLLQLICRQNAKHAKQTQCKRIFSFCFAVCSLRCVGYFCIFKRRINGISKRIAYAYDWIHFFLCCKQVLLLDILHKNRFQNSI